MIRIENLKKQFGEKTAVDIEQFSVRNGEMLGLVGNNGAGKTTLFRLILDLLEADAGCVELQSPTHREVADGDEKNISPAEGDGIIINPAKSEEWKVMHPDSTATTKNGSTGTEASVNETITAATADTKNTQSNARVASGECPIFFKKNDTLLFVNMLVNVATRLMSAAKIAMNPLPSLPHICVVKMTAAKLSNSISTLTSAVRIKSL